MWKETAVIRPKHPFGVTVSSVARRSVMELRNSVEVQALPVSLPSPDVQSSASRSGGLFRGELFIAL